MRRWMRHVVKRAPRSVLLFVLGVAAAASSGAVEKPFHVHDIHASILDLMAIDHIRTTYMHNGRAERPTIVSGSVIQELSV